MPVRSRTIRRGVFGITALVAIAAVALFLAGRVPGAPGGISSLFPSSTKAVASQVPQQMAQATGGKGARDGATVDNSNNTRTTRSFGGWTVVCNEGGEPVRRVCSANFRVINQQNNSNILVWLVGFNAEGELLSEFLTLTDIQIQPGVGVSLESGEAVTAPFVECSTRGCKARLTMSDSFLQQLKAASNATIAITRIDGQVIQFQMQIPGVDQALAELGV